MADKFTTISSILTSASIPNASYERPIGSGSIVVFKSVSEIDQYSHQAVLFDKARFQFDCYAETLAVSRSLGTTIQTLFRHDKTNFNDTWALNKFTVKDIETNLYRTIVDVMIF